MIEAFVDRLREMTEAERAVLFLVNGDGKRLVQAALPLRRPLAAGIVRQEHAEFEAILAETAIRAEASRSAGQVGSWRGWASTR